MSLVSMQAPSKPVFQKRAIDVHGAADLSFTNRDGETAIKRLYYREPLKILFPRGDVPTAALVTTGGGLFGGDRYDVNVELEDGSGALVTAQAAEKVYRSSGPDCEITVNLKVGDHAVLEWLPQETILFDRARFRRKTCLDVQGEGCALVGEILVFGRLASGEEVQEGLIREEWEIRQDGKTKWRDAFHLQDDLQRCLNHKSGFGGARAMATAVYVADDCAEKLEIARELMGAFEGVRLGTTVVNDILVCRWLAHDPYALRRAFGTFWAAFRHDSLGRQAQLPRLWHC